MILEKRRNVLVYFGVIYFVFIIILIYLMAFNAGLTIEETMTGDSLRKIILIKNNSAKTINNITVSYLEDNGKVKIADINRLLVAEEFELDYIFPEGVDRVKLVAEAPFYLSVSKEITISKPSTGFRYNIRAAAQLFRGIKFVLNFQLCNPFTNQKSALVEERHDSEFFSEGQVTASAIVDADSCKDIDYELTPVKAGTTTIYFKIDADGITDDYQITVKVNE
jgi:hypothetical protein